jgi:hypothetical protein
VGDSINSNPQVTLKALSFFDNGNLRRLSKPMEDLLAKGARDVDLDQLPIVARPSPRRANNEGPPQ